MREGIVEVFNQWFDSKLTQMHTVIPGRIVQYYGHSERKAKVQPAIKLRTQRNQEITLEPIDDVPVIFPGSSNFNILYPLKKDDGILLLFSEASIGEFLTSRQNIVSADSAERFSLTDCIAIPGLWSFLNVPTEGDGTFIQLNDDGSLNIEAETGKTMTLTNQNCTIEMDSTNLKMNNSTCDIEIGTASVKINNGNLEVLI